MLPRSACSGFNRELAINRFCWLLETCGLSAGAYRLWQALGALDAANAATDPSSEIWDTPSSSPVVPQAWADSLRRHPDQRFTAWLLRGLSEGFQIGYGGGSGKRARASRNLQSAREHPAVVAEYISTAKLRQAEWWARYRTLRRTRCA